MTAMTYSPVPTRSEARPRYTLSFSGAVASEWIKLRSMRFTWWNTVLQLALGTGMAAMMAWSMSLLVADGDQMTVDGMIAVIANQGVVFVGTVIALVIGVLAVTSEYASGSIRSTLAADPRRGAVLAAKALVVAGFTAVLGIAAEVVGLAISAAIAVPGGIDFDTGPETWKAVAGAVFYLVVCGLVGLGLGFALRSSAGAIAMGLGVFFVLDIVLSLGKQAIDALRVVHEVLPSSAGGLVYSGPMAPDNSVLGGYWGGVA
ncbi:MAG: ABC transporter permease, partial [Propionibacteriaceae bacterium]|nr:ABC transporter permease [Propionibacteriaceae bacterium]